MTAPAASPGSCGCDALLSAALLAVCGGRLGGAAIRGGSRAARETWIGCASIAGDGVTEQLRIPLDIADGELCGGVDLMATVAAGKPVSRPGLLERAAAHVPAVVAMADRWTAPAAARLWSAVDAARRLDSSGGGGRPVVALDESVDGDERPSRALVERLAFHLDLDRVAPSGFESPDELRQSVRMARERLHRVRVSDDLVAALVGCGASFGVASGHADALALTTARAHAALAGRDAAIEEDVAVAARLVYGPRATQMPSEPQREADEPAGEQSPQPTDNSPPDREPAGQPEGDVETEMTERLLEAVKTSLPPDVLSLAASGAGRARTPAVTGRAKSEARIARNGRRAQSRKGDPRRDGPLDLVATFLAAAPWQRLRVGWLRRQQAIPRSHRLIVTPGDMHVKRFKRRAPRTTIFAVDASGSAALARLDEAKGAVELLLADCYVRRDRVGLVAFRRQSADILLPPTRSLTRAKRALSGLPGGGGTPLAGGLEAARALAASERRTGHATLVVVLTDGHANVDLQGRPGRRSADADAMAAAHGIRADRLSALLIDISPRPQSRAAAIAEKMAARYIALPEADATRIYGAVRDSRIAHGL